VHWGVATALSFEVQVAAPQRWEPEYVRNTNSSMTSGPPEFDVALFDLALRRKSKASERVLKSTIYNVDYIVNVLRFDFSEFVPGNASTFLRLLP
jgi:hypothetical protein